MNLEEWLIQADLYSAGALTDTEEKAFQDRLGLGDDISRRLHESLEENQNALFSLTTKMPAVKPPPELKAKIMKKALSTGAGGGFFNGRVLFFILMTILFVAILTNIILLKYTMKPALPILESEHTESIVVSDIAESKFVTEKKADAKITSEKNLAIRKPTLEVAKESLETSLPKGPAYSAFDLVDSLKNNFSKSPVSGRDVIVGSLDSRNTASMPSKPHNDFISKELPDNSSDVY